MDSSSRNKGSSEEDGEKSSAQAQGHVIPRKVGSGDCYQHCILERENSTSFHLFLATGKSLSEKGKLLFAARRNWCGTHFEYTISQDPDDLSRNSKTRARKLRSDFRGLNYAIYENKPPQNGKMSSSSRGCLFPSKRVSPQAPAASNDCKIGQVCYKWNIIPRGPRKIVCFLKFPPHLEEVPTVEEASEFKVFRNKRPWWEEKQEHWCLNFSGPVTIPSVKNFQLLGARPRVKGDGEVILLQFQKVRTREFTMDYRQPLSAFQALAICLTQFGPRRFST